MGVVGVPDFVAGKAIQRRGRGAQAERGRIEGACGCRGAVSGVGATQHPETNEDTGQRDRGQSRNIPQCLAEPRSTGVLNPCDVPEGVRRRPVLDRVDPAGCSLAPHRESGLPILQASRSFRLVRCQDDRGSYPRPKPERYRLAQTTAASTSGADDYCFVALLEVPPPVERTMHPICQRPAIVASFFQSIECKSDGRRASRVEKAAPAGAGGREHETNI